MRIDSGPLQPTIENHARCGRGTMRSRIVHLIVCLLGIAVVAQQSAFAADAEHPFHLEEATIADVHRAIRAGQITAERLVNLYFKRIEAYNGACVKGQREPESGLMYGEITPIANA